MIRTALLLLWGGASAVSCYATLTVSLGSSPASPQPVGTPVTWTATATDTEAGSLDYQFSVAGHNGVFQVVQDYSETATMTWAPSDHEGSFSISVIARNKAAGESTQTRCLTR